MVTLVPVDTGRPTAKSEKVAVIDGTCRWANPIYETVLLVRDPKTGRINEKVYRFLVSTTVWKIPLIAIIQFLEMSLIS